MGSSAVVVVVLHSYSLAKKEDVCQHRQYKCAERFDSLYECLPQCISNN